jgi:hypothetical protein
MQVMITNGGPHPADKWADTTTESILGLIEIAEDSDTPQATMARQAKRDLRPVLFKILMEHHDKVQKHERGQLAKAKQPMVTDRYDPSHHFEGGIMAKVEQAFAATPFAGWFAEKTVRDVIYRTIGRDTVNAMHIERGYHRDRLAKGA